MTGIDNAGLRDSLMELLPRIKQYLVTNELQAGMTWTGLIEPLISLARTVTPEQWEHFVTDYPDIMHWQSHVARLYARYISEQEYQESVMLLDRYRQNRDRNGLVMMGEFAQKAYARVEDMFEQVDFHECRRFVMVGCGPLPVTLFHVMQSTNVPELIGLDADERAIGLVQCLIATFELQRILVCHTDGEGFNFKDADVVYVANLISPKQAVLTRIADTVAPGTRVILRDPFSIGELLAERGAENLDPRFSLLGTGIGDARFFSRHLFLERRV